MKKKFHILFPATILIASLFYTIIATALVDYFPHQFYGSVIVNGVSAPDGVLISAKLNARDVGGGLTADGKYGSKRPAFVVMLHEQYEEQTIEFYVQNVKAAEYPFLPGNSTELDLSVTIPNFCGDNKCESGESCSSCSEDCGTCPSEEEEERERTVTTETGPCQEEWICTDWLECFNNVQKRVCADVNRCGTTEKKPIEEQDCEMETICEPEERKCRGDVLMICTPSGTMWIDIEECEFGCENGKCVEKEAAEESLSITGLLTLIPSQAIIGIITIVLIVIIFFGWRRVFRKKTTYSMNELSIEAL